MQEKNLNLTKAETLIMNAVWSEGKEISIQNLIKKVEDVSGRKYARTTVVTFLGKIAQKGLIETKRKGKEAYIYPLVSKETCVTHALHEFVTSWFSVEKDFIASEMNKLQ